MPDLSAAPSRRSDRSWRRTAALAIAAVLVLATSAGAHFLLNLNVRILHVDHLAEGLRVYMRMPMPYLVAGEIGPATADGLPEPAPFTSNARMDGQIMHYVDPAQIDADPTGLGRLAEEGFAFEAGGRRLQGEVEAVRLYRVGKEPGFATLAEARSSFRSDFNMPKMPPPLFVGDAVVDVIIRYSAGEPVPVYRVSSTLDPGLPGQENTANLILDYGPGDPLVFRSRGLLADPVEISRGTFAAVRTFVYEGIRHILEGADHVLFVVCLVIGAATLRSLLWRVTGFTIGHSVTLALGFFGYVPTGAWFVPLVETGIALSIVYAAVLAIRPRPQSGRSETGMFFVTVLIGLLHGLGFSFVLQEILQITSPNIWLSLLSFNIGVEFGQLAIVLAIWPVFFYLKRVAPSAGWLARSAVAAACLVIALFWTAERITQTLAVFA